MRKPTGETVLFEWQQQLLTIEGVIAVATELLGSFGNRCTELTLTVTGCRMRLIITEGKTAAALYESVCAAIVRHCGSTPVSCRVEP